MNNNKRKEIELTGTTIKATNTVKGMTRGKTKRRLRIPKGRTRETHKDRNEGSTNSRQLDGKEHRR